MIDVQEAPTIEVAPLLSTTDERTAVVGAGIIGLTTAIVAQEAGHNVTIFTDRPTEETTSARAAASVKPHAVVYDTRAALMLRQSLKDFGLMACDPESGVRHHTHWEAFTGERDNPDYIRMMNNVSYFRNEPDQIPGGYPNGWRYQTYFADITQYLPYLRDMFLGRGGHIEMVHLDGPTDFRKLGAGLVFNCTGLGARELLQDDKMEPVKGQVAYAGPQPGMDWSISAKDQASSYIYPRSTTPVLGGTAEWGVDDDEVDAATIDRIVKDAKRILPNLAAEDVQRTVAGRRPYRHSGIRLGVERRDGIRVVHNYGHGGAGITLSWGSARMALYELGRS